MSTGIAVIGTGYWGPGIVRNLARIESVKLHHLVDLDLGAAQSTAERFAPEAAAHSSVDRALADDDVDAVVIATPIRRLLELARWGLRAGNHVLVEKPLAMSVGECR